MSRIQLFNLFRHITANAHYNYFLNTLNFGEKLVELYYTTHTSYQVFKVQYIDHKKCLRSILPKLFTHFNPHQSRIYFVSSLSEFNPSTRMVHVHLHYFFEIAFLIHRLLIQIRNQNYNCLVAHFPRSSTEPCRAPLLSHLIENEN